MKLFFSTNFLKKKQTENSPKELLITYEWLTVLPWAGIGTGHLQLTNQRRSFHSTITQLVIFSSKSIDTLMKMSYHNLILPSWLCSALLSFFDAFFLVKVARKNLSDSLCSCSQSDAVIVSGMMTCLCLTRVKPLTEWRRRGEWSDIEDGTQHQ